MTKTQHQAKLSTFGITYLVLEEQGYAIKGSKYLRHKQKQNLNRFLKHAKTLSSQIERPINETHEKYMEQCKEILFDALEKIEELHLKVIENEQDTNQEN